MSKFEFFSERVDRWGNSMRALWGSLGICPLIDHTGLPCHMSEELHSISHLKVWGDVQKLLFGMAYLLERVNDTSEAGTYGMAIVWVSSLQARASSMVEALEMLSSLTSKGSDWSYILIQLYEGTNLTPLPKDRHICVLPQEKAERPSGQISQLKSHWLLTARPLVVFPMELNGDDQLVTIDLPKSLHTRSSITADEYPYIKINIPTPIPEEQDCTSLPLGRKHDPPTTTQPKAPWKPRVTLTAEVKDLIDRGMMDNYDQELEHSITVEVTTTEADAIPPLKTEMPVLSLDASSQASAAETEASMESSPVSTPLTAVAHSSCSSSPIVDFSELQSDVHMAVSSMLTARRSTDLKIQRAI